MQLWLASCIFHWLGEWGERGRLKRQSGRNSEKENRRRATGKGESMGGGGWDEMRGRKKQNVEE